MWTLLRKMNQQAVIAAQQAKQQFIILTENVDLLIICCCFVCVCVCVCVCPFIICCRQIAGPHQNCTKCGLHNNLSGFNLLNRNVRMVACCWVGWFPSVRANNAPKSTLLKLKYVVLRHWSSCCFINCWKLDQRKSVFPRFLYIPLTISVEL